ncbi:peptidylprolyl isomerase [Synechococcus sp. GFB01]|uniref:peptidylprolyl isomerase n=1 Tax=Synechococcus sp. GFB01 TaxID=1662190 RepID=UPI00064F9836|nr:peptidylprolyl isomerase [Synechococcus sp. GFB01]
MAQQPAPSAGAWACQARRALLSLAILPLLSLALLLPTPVQAALPQGNAVKDPSAILRNALPVEAPDLQDLQHRLEATSDDLRAKRWAALVNTVRRSQARLGTRHNAILEQFGSSDRPQAETLLDQLAEHLQALATAAEAEQRDAFLAARRDALASIGEAEALLVGPFPYAIPSQFDALPRLLGRATVEIETSKGDLTAVVDGYNAPLTAGAFIDLVEKGFYDGLPFTRAEDFYVLQTGDPEGPASGYVDPRTKQERTVPLEIRIPGESAPFYNQTFEDLGLFKAEAVLPFATLGTLGWAHSDERLDDGSSQFFFFLYEPELTPAGLNLVDGRYSAFGYVVDGFDVLGELGVDDRIVKIRLIDGAENLQSHG